MGDQATIENATVQFELHDHHLADHRAHGRPSDRCRQYDSCEPRAPHLLVVTQMEPIFVTFTLPEETLDAMTAAMRRGAVPVEAYKRDNGTLLSTGALTVVDNQIDTTTGTIRLKATFANSGSAAVAGRLRQCQVVTRDQA